MSHGYGKGSPAHEWKDGDQYKDPGISQTYSEAALHAQRERELQRPRPDYTKGDFVEATGSGVVDELRAKFPHGHPEFIPMTVGEMKLHSEKNFDYAAGGDPLGNFKRVATILAQYPGLQIDDPAIVAMIYALKQLDAYFWLKAQGRDGKVEGKAARLGDISVYTKIARIIEQDATEGRGNK